MAAVTTLDNFIGPWGDLSLAASDVLGQPFTMASTFDCTHVGWYRGATGSGRAPNTLAIYEVGNSTALWGPTTASDDGTVGMQWTALGTPLSLTSGHTYVVCGYWVSGSNVAYVAGSSRATAPSLITWPTDTRRLEASVGAMTYPTSGDTTHWYGITPYLDNGSDPPGPHGTVGYEVEQAFTRWLSTSDNTRPLGLPKTTKTQADAIKTVVDAIQAVTDVLGDLNAAAITRLNDLSDAAIDGLNAASDGANEWMSTVHDRLTGASGGGGSAFTGLADKIDALPPLITALQPPITGVGWALVDTQAFSGPLAWAQAADLYVVNFTSTPARLGHIDVDGVDWVPRLGWWTEWDGTYSGERHFIDFPYSYMYLPGRHLGGLLLWCEPGGEGTVEAWSYTP